jgi:hypothetical protein
LRLNSLFAREIMNTTSYPTMRRKAIAATTMAGGFFLTIAVKVVRGRFETEIPPWIMDSLPNFICGAAIPFAILLSDRVFRLRDFLVFNGLIALGLIAYELVQIVMPTRTFELMDLAASAAGAMVPLAVGWTLFRDKTQEGEQSHALEPAAGPIADGQSSPPAQ